MSLLQQILHKILLFLRFINTKRRERFECSLLFDHNPGQTLGRCHAIDNQSCRKHDVFPQQGSNSLLPHKRGFAPGVCHIQIQGIRFQVPSGYFKTGSFENKIHCSQQFFVLLAENATFNWGNKFPHAILNNTDCHCLTTFQSVFVTTW